MVKLTNVLSLTGNGLRDWLVQRVTSVILTVYLVFLLGFMVLNPGLDYFTWQGLFISEWMRVFSLLALLSLTLHAYVGLWTIITDYLPPVALRLAAHIVVIIALIGYFIWGIQILWGV